MAISTIQNASLASGVPNSAAIGTGTIAQTNLATGVAGTGPAFSAYSNNSQTISSGTQTKVTFDTEEFDTNSNFSSNRFTPTVAGYYQLNTMISWLSVSANVVFIVLYKNGSIYKYLQRMPKTAQYIWIGGSSLAYANGTTDYFEIYCYQDSGSNMTIDSGVGYTWFNGSLVRAA
jgi:hypothetical protein